MKIRQIATAAVLLAVGIVPSIACAGFILDTGTPAGVANVVLNASNWYAAEFSVSPGVTDITALSAYLTGTSDQVGKTFTWDIYSTTGTFLGPNRETPTFTATGTFSANGWNSTSVDWTPTAPGNYWVALQVSGSSQTSGLDLPTEASTGTGTVPATNFAYAGTNARYALETNNPVGFEITATAVPLPSTAWLFGGGVLGLGSLAGRRRRSES